MLPNVHQDDIEDALHPVSQNKQSHIEFSWFQMKKKTPKQSYWKGENKQERVLHSERNNESFQVLKLTTILALLFRLPARQSVWKPLNPGSVKNT